MLKRGKPIHASELNSTLPAEEMSLITKPLSGKRSSDAAGFSRSTHRKDSVKKAKIHINIADSVSELGKKFDINTDKTSISISLTDDDYSSKQRNGIVKILRRRVKSKNTPYDSFLKSQYFSQTKTFVFTIKPDASLPPNLSLEECVNNLLQPVKPRVPWNKIKPTWIDASKTAVKISHAIISTKKVGLQDLNQKISNHPHYGDNIIHIEKLPDWSISACFVDGRKKHQGKNLKKCIKEILESKKVQVRDRFQGYFYFADESNKTVAKLIRGEYPDNRTLCHRINLRRQRKAKQETIPCFFLIDISYRHDDLLAKIRKGKNLPNGITLAACLEQLGLKQVTLKERHKIGNQTSARDGLRDPTPSLATQNNSTDIPVIARDIAVMKISFILNPETNSTEFLHSGGLFAKNNNSRTTSIEEVNDSTHEKKRLTKLFPD